MAAEHVSRLAGVVHWARKALKVYGVFCALAVILLLPVVIALAF